MLTFSLKLLKQVRALRGSLSSKTRDAIFAIFGETALPTINTNSSATEIANWKKRLEVAECYKGLFEKINERSPTGLLRIIQKVFLDKKDFSNAELAYVIAICTMMLNPKHDAIKLKKEMMMRKVKYYLVGLQFTILK